MIIQRKKGNSDYEGSIPWQKIGDNTCYGKRKSAKGCDRSKELLHQRTTGNLSCISTSGLNNVGGNGRSYLIKGDHPMIKDEDLRQLQQQLLENPKAGDVLKGTGGLRKYRIAL